MNLVPHAPPVGFQIGFCMRALRFKDSGWSELRRLTSPQPASRREHQGRPSRDNANWWDYALAPLLACDSRLGPTRWERGDDGWTFSANRMTAPSFHDRRAIRYSI